MIDPSVADAAWRTLSHATVDVAHAAGAAPEPADPGADADHPLLDRIAADWSGADPPTAGQITRWRKAGDAALVAAAIDAVIARRRLDGRWPEARRALADREAAEQATPADVSTAKAARLADGATVVWDLGCGAGGDAMRLAAIPSLRVIVVVDRDVRRITMAMHNVIVAARAAGRRGACTWADGHTADAARVAVRAAEADADSDAADGPGTLRVIGVVAEIDSAFAAGCRGAVVHLDPSRRQEGQGRRRLRLADHDPGPDVIAALVQHARRLAVKLGPGLDPGELESAGVGGAEIEYIARDGRMVQAVAWYGDGARPDGRRATQWTIESEAAPARADTIEADAAADDGARWRLEPHGQPEAGDWLLVPRPAIERAGLVWTALVAAAPTSPASELAPGLGILVGPEAVHSPWFQAWRIREIMPWRQSRVRDRMRELSAGIVTVRTRGGAVDPDRVSRSLRGSGDVAIDLHVLRVGQRIEAFVVDRG